MYAVVCLKEVRHILSKGVCWFPGGLVITEPADLIIKTGCAIPISAEIGMGHDRIDDMLNCSN